MMPMMLVTVVSLRRKLDYGQSINEKRSVADDFDDENVDEKAERNTFYSIWSSSPKSFFGWLSHTKLGKR